MSNGIRLFAIAAVLLGLAAFLSAQHLVRESQATLAAPEPEAAASTVRFAAHRPAAATTPAATSRDRTSIDSKNGADWPCLHGPDRNGRSAETGLTLEWGPEGPPELWRRDVGTGYSAPVVSGSRVVVHHRVRNEERITALDADSGETLWEHSTPTSYECRFAYSSGPYATPSFAGDSLVALTAQGRLIVLDAATGALRWERDLAKEFDVPEMLFGVGASPCCEEGRIYLNLGGRKDHAAIVALEASTGRTVWQAGDDAASYATPVLATIHGERFLFVFTGHGLVALDPATGGIDWTIPFGNDSSPDRANAVTPLVSNDLVFVTAGPGPGALCVRVLADRSYEEVWRDRRALDSQFNNVVLHDGCVFGFTSKWRRATSFRCLELATGRMRWEWRSDLERGSSVIAGNHLLLLGEHGHLASMELNTQEAVVLSMTAEPLLESPAYSAPALSRGRLYLRNEKRVLCLSLK